MTSAGYIITKLRRPLMGILGASLLAGALFLWAANSLQDARQENAAAWLRKQQMEQNLARAVAEAGNIGERSAHFQQLRESGVVGEEQRAQWASVLHDIQQDRQPLNIEYEFGAKAPVATGQNTSPTFSTRLLLQAEVRHETDLLQLVARLEREIRALIAWQNCQLTRSDTAPPRLGMRCEISLITLQPGAKVQ
ncbi:MAG: hypothetical protein WAV95_13400 [Azonexus sp.]